MADTHNFKKMEEHLKEMSDSLAEAFETGQSGTEGLTGTGVN